MPRYKLKEGFCHREKPGDPMKAGSIVEMTEKRFHSLRDRFELLTVPAPVSAPEPVSDPEPIEEAPENWDAEFKSMTAKEARATVNEMEDIEDLLSILESETRSTVKGALVDRIEKLS